MLQGGSAELGGLHAARKLLGPRGEALAGHEPPAVCLTDGATGAHIQFGVEAATPGLTHERRDGRDSDAGGALVAAERAAASERLLIVKEAANVRTDDLSVMRPSVARQSVWRGAGTMPALRLRDTPVIDVTMWRCGDAPPALPCSPAESVSALQSTEATTAVGQLPAASSPRRSACIRSRRSWPWRCVLTGR
ncbi:MAG: hypothetical protein ACI81R_001675 [Bradymonadia bacterium]